MISVVVPAYNAAETIGRTLESLGAQTHEDFEVIVVDDGSTDTTATIAKRFADADARFRMISQRNGGTHSALNTAYSHARFDLLVSVDADDAVDPTFLQTLADDASRHPEFDIWSRNLKVIPEDGEPVDFHDWSVPHEVTLDEMLGGAVIPGAGTLFRREIFEALGGYRPTVIEDQDFWLRALAARFRHRYTPGVCYFYHLREGGKSASTELLFRARADAIDDLVSTGVLSPDQVRIGRRWAESIPSMISGIEREARRRRIKSSLEPWLGWVFPLIRRVRRWIASDGDS